MLASYLDHFYRMIPRRGRIVGDPTNIIGQGGNYIATKPEKDVSGFGDRLIGKATAGSDIEMVERKKPKNNFVKFTVDPITGGPERSELALGNNFDFDETVRIEMEFKVKAREMDELRGYILQFWRPVVSPIAGVRVANGRLEAVTRTAGGAASKALDKGWNEVELLFTAGDEGFLKIQGDLNGEAVGGVNSGGQEGKALADTFRAKFGWYGSTDQDVEVRFRKFALEVV